MKELENGRIGQNRSEWREVLLRKWSDEQIEQRIAPQWPVEKKIAAADFVIWTDTTLDMHAAQLDRILSKTSA